MVGDSCLHLEKSKHSLDLNTQCPCTEGYSFVITSVLHLKFVYVAGVLKILYLCHHVLRLTDTRLLSSVITYMMGRKFMF